MALLLLEHVGVGHLPLRYEGARFRRRHSRHGCDGDADEQWRWQSPFGPLPDPRCLTIRTCGTPHCWEGAGCRSRLCRCRSVSGLRARRKGATDFHNDVNYVGKNVRAFRPHRRYRLLVREGAREAQARRWREGAATARALKSAEKNAPRTLSMITTTRAMNGRLVGGYLDMFLMRPDPKRWLPSVSICIGISSTRAL